MTLIAVVAAEVFGVDCNLAEQASVTIYLTLLATDNFIVGLQSHSGNFSKETKATEECYSNTD